MKISFTYIGWITDKEEIEMEGVAMEDDGIMEIDVKGEDRIKNFIVGIEGRERGGKEGIRRKSMGNEGEHLWVSLEEEEDDKE